MRSARGDTLGAGCRKLKKTFKDLGKLGTAKIDGGWTNPPIIQSTRPMTHIRKVITGISGSSMLETDARTSGKGLSSSLTASKSNSILEIIEQGLNGGKEATYLIEPSRLSSSNMLGVKSRVVSSAIVEDRMRFRRDD